MYAFVVLHKLNWDFLDPEYSCAVEMYHAVNEMWGGWFPEARSRLFSYGLISFTLGAEALIPILLLVPSTRFLAMGLGLIFHTLLMLHPNAYIMGYSTIVLALYTVFLPQKTASMLLDEVLRRRLAALIGLFLWALLSVAVVVVRAWFLDDLNRQGVIASLHQSTDYLFPISWIVAHALIASLVWKAYWATAPMGSDHVMTVRGLTHPAVVMVVVMWINGIAPYLGLYSSHTWSMFSNLKAEGERTNHLVFTGAWRPFSFLTDTYLVLDGSESRVVKLSSGGDLQVTAVEIRRIMGNVEAPGRYVVLARPGESPRRVRFAEEPDHEVFRPLPWWMKKIFQSRRTPPGDTPCHCMH